MTMSRRPFSVRRSGSLKSFSTSSQGQDLYGLMAYLRKADFLLYVL